MNQNNGKPASDTSPSKRANQPMQPLSTQGLLIVFAALAVAVVLGWLLLNKLVSMSQDEDCALAQRYNCGAIVVPR